MTWIIWAIVLIAQNASFTLVSRARNSGSLGFHTIASVLSNGIWFASFFIVLDKLEDAKKAAGTDWGLVIWTGLFYTAFTVIGSVIMHYVSARWLEKGKRRVGAAMESTSPAPSDSKVR